MRVHVGEKDPAFCISKVVLCNISRKVDELVDVAKKGNVLVDGLQSISLHGDDHEAWKILLYWTVTRCLPGDVTDSEVLMVRAWALGEKYEVVEFQDEVMLSLLLRCESNSMEVDAIESAFLLTHPGSKLRCLMAEELIWTIEETKNGPATLLADSCDVSQEGFVPSVGGVAVDIIEAKNRCKDVEEYWRRFVVGDDEEHGRWQTFMVGEGLRVQGRAMKEEFKASQG